MGFASAAHGAIEIEPTISIGLARTDNVALAPDGEERSETVYQLIPTLDLTQDSARFSTDLAYRFDGYYYDESSDSHVYHLLDATFSAALDPDNFFFDLGASRNQSIRDPEAPISRGNLPRSGNRIERDQVYLGPSFQYPLGPNLTMQGSYRHTEVRYGDDEVQAQGGSDIAVLDFDSDAITWSVDNYRRGRGLTWAVRYSADEADYGIFEPWQYRRAGVELGGWVTSGLRIFASGGKESEWDNPFDPSLEDDFWEVGLATPVEARFSAEIAAGERGFGPTRRGSLGWSFRRGSTTFSYNEQATTQGLSPFHRGGLRFREEPEDFLAGLGTERFLSKRLQWNVQVALRRSGFSVTVFDERREDIVQLDGTPAPEESQQGAMLGVTWQVGARTDLSAILRRADRTFGESGIDREYESASILAGYRIGARSRLSLEYVRASDRAEDGDADADYTENLISLLFTREF